MPGTDDDFSDDDLLEWYEVVKAREFHPLADDFPEFAAVLSEELRTHLAGLVRRLHKKPPEGDLWISWSLPDALRIGFGTDGTDAYDFCTMRWDQTLEDASPNAESLIESIADQWPREPKSSS
jgi:hypothetical protein